MQYFTLKEVAELIGCSTQTVCNYLHRYQLADYRVGRRRLVPLETLNQLNTIHVRDGNKDRRI